MMRVLEGKLVDSGIKVGIVAARFNEFIVSKLVAGAKDGLVRHDVSEENIDLAWVPGAFEIPLIASKMAKSGKYEAVICLGAVIRAACGTSSFVKISIFSLIISPTKNFSLTLVITSSSKYLTSSFKYFLITSISSVVLIPFIDEIGTISKKLYKSFNLIISSYNLSFFILSTFVKTRITSLLSSFNLLRILLSFGPNPLAISTRNKTKSLSKLE